MITPKLLEWKAETIWPEDCEEFCACDDCRAQDIHPLMPSAQEWGQ